MSYLSNVRIITTSDGWNKLKEFSNRYLQEKRGMDYTCLFDFENCCVHSEEVCELGITTYPKIVYIGWDNIEWYENEDTYDDIDSIMKGLYYLKDLDIPYRYARISEDYRDYEEMGHMNVDIADIPYISVVRDFDDICTLKEIKKENEND
jgi:hypothetical protein